MQITSPNGRVADISTLERLLTEAAIRSMGGVYSEIGRAFSWSSSIHDILMNETVLLIKNTFDSYDLVIDKILCSGLDAGFDIHLPASATFSGTAITGVCLNQNYNYDDNADAYQHETVNTQANVIVRGFAPQELNFNGEIRIGTGKCIAVDYEAETKGAVTIIGHFEG